MKKQGFETFLYKEKGSLPEQIWIVLSLSLPAILAQVTSIAMQYIDAGMVGSLGANATAAIGLVSSSTWLIGGTSIGLATGFSVQVAQMVGARRFEDATDVLRQSFSMLLLIGLGIALLGAGVSRFLPGWLGGQEEILADAGIYFFIYSCSVPFVMMRQLASSMMQASGDMRTPGILSAMVCLLDVFFNMLLIFPARKITISSLPVTIPGAGLGVKGAALGTAFSDIIIALIMLYMLCFRNQKLDLRKPGSWRWKRNTIETAARIAIPISLDQFFMCSAYIAATKIVAGIGTNAVAANSLAITAESLCYMPGYGIAVAATTIIGQTIGANRRDLTKSFSRVIVILGMTLMGAAAVFMFIMSPVIFSLLTSDPQVAKLGTQVLRMELIAEPFYGASFCCAGIFRGAGDTFIPSMMNLCSMWGVRIILAFFLVPRLGLQGYWLAMTIELYFRGTIFLIRLLRGSWYRKSIFQSSD